MRIAVIGAGVIGVTTAYELAGDGHEVTLYERRGNAAAETSFANAGVISPGYAAPWAAPGMPGKVLRGFVREHSAVRFEGIGGPRTWAWLWRWWRACDAKGYAERRSHMLALARASQTRLREITQALDLAWEQRRGYLVLLRSDVDVMRARPALSALEDLGLRASIVDAGACRAIEPGLNAHTPLAAGLHWPDDDVGNCRQFTLQLLEHATARGVKLRSRHHVRDLRIDERGATLRIDAREARAAAQTTSRMVYPERGTHGAKGAYAAAGGTAKGDADHDDGPQSTFESGFDGVVVCAGPASSALLRSARVRVPLLAVHGYSVTAPLRNHADPMADTAPRAGLMDEAYKVAISRIGDRVRVAGGAAIGGRDDEVASKSLATLYKVLHDWFPNAAQLSMVTPWKGARPMLPDGPPIVGPTRHARLWLNLGHGSSGWALACGSARLLADQIAGRATAIDARGYSIERYR